MAKLFLRRDGLASEMAVEVFPMILEVILLVFVLHVLGVALVADFDWLLVELLPRQSFVQRLASAVLAEAVLVGQVVVVRWVLHM